MELTTVRAARALLQGGGVQEGARTCEWVGWTQSSGAVLWGGWGLGVGRGVWPAGTCLSACTEAAVTHQQNGPTCWGLFCLGVVWGCWMGLDRGDRAACAKAFCVRRSCSHTTTRLPGSGLSGCCPAVLLHPCCCAVHLPVRLPAAPAGPPVSAGHAGPQSRQQGS